MTTLTVITANLGNPQHSNDARDQAPVLRALIKDHAPDVICVQEAAAGLQAPKGYLKHQGHGGLTEIPIFHRAALKCTAHLARESFGGLFGKWPDRGHVVIDLEASPWRRAELGVHVVTVINTHLNPHIDDGGKPFPGVSWNRTQRQLADLDEAVQTSTSLGHRVIMCGDWNIDRRADTRRAHRDFPHLRFADLGLREVHYPGASCGKGAIDRVFYTEGTVLGRGSRVLPKGPHFDHHPVIAHLEVTA